MIIQPKIRGFICTTAHPTGCAKNIKNQITYSKEYREQNKRTIGSAVSTPKKVLIIGCSTGYGLASRIASAYCYDAATIGVMFEKPAHGTRCATAGWYNTAAFETNATADGLYAATINGDAFSDEIKEATIKKIKKDLGKVDMVIYSLAAPRRTLPSGEVCSSVLKTTGSNYTGKTLDLRHNTIEEITIPAATKEEIDATIQVMGGEDWAAWLKQLVKADAIADHAITVAYSYIGPALTYPIYKDGTIGLAKDNLADYARNLNKLYTKKDLHAYISVNKALVTQASSAIPVVPLYISLLYKVQKKLGMHEGCIEQICRLFFEKLFVSSPVLDTEDRIRMDDYELNETVQHEIEELFNSINTENVSELADLSGYQHDFQALFGFGVDGVDYTKDISPNVAIPSISATDY